MGLSIKFNVAGEIAGAVAQIENQRAALLGAKLNVQIGRKVSDLFKDRLFKLDGQRANKLRGERTHFYADAAKGTFSEGNETEAVVTVAQQGFRQRVQGGTIRPIKRKYLTIPARAEAYGHVARDFKNLKFVKTARGGMLVEADSTNVSFGRPRKDGTRKVTQGAARGGGAYFWLVPSVTQKGDHTILPRDEDVSEAVRGVVAAAVKRIRG